ncbi:hypothetical protein HY448_02055 [Candidatus Pacearchaeota archaeon]|nr:hypothetical protein [Candidatus Pacearchaeota archaeon]
MEKELVKRAVIAGASYAIKHMERNPRANESEVMAKVMKDIKKIVAEIEEVD